MDDWYDMLPVQRYAPPYRIQWSPTGKVRAKKNEDNCWKTAACSKACYAEGIGLYLLKEGYNETVSYLPSNALVRG